MDWFDAFHNNPNVYKIVRRALYDTMETCHTLLEHHQKHLDGDGVLLLRDISFTVRVLIHGVSQSHARKIRWFSHVDHLFNDFQQKLLISQRVPSAETIPVVDNRDEQLSRF